MTDTQSFSPKAEAAQAGFATVAKQSAVKDASVKCVKVFHLINGEHFSGAERVQDLLATALPTFGYEVGFGVTKDGIFAESRNCQTAPIHDCTMRSRLDSRAVAKAVQTIQQHDYSLIHAHTPRSLMIAMSAAKKTGLPVVYHVHSPVGRDSNRKMINWINTQIEQRNLRRTAAMICVSDSLKGYMQELGHSDEKLTVVPNGVPCQSKAPAERPLPGPKWTLGTVALFRPRKGTEVLLEAFAKLVKQGANLHLHAVGPFETPEYGIEILGLAEKLEITDSITWTGFTRDAISEFSKMDLFVLPSLYGEGLPMVVLESMASGVPVIASDVEGIPQAIRDQQDGLIFKASDVDDLVEKIQSMMDGQHDWQRMRESAHTRQRDHFSEHSMAQGVAKVYDRILTRNRS